MTSNRSIWDGIPEGLDGDRTTAGSYAISSLPNFSTEGIGALRHGDKTTPCPACGQVGELIGNIPFVTLHGRCAAGNNAVVTCGCPLGSNRLISPAGPVGRGGLQSTRGVSQSQPVQYAQTTHGHPHHQQANQHEEALSTTCACDRDITMAEFRQIATGALKGELKGYLDSINLWLPWKGITTCRGKAHFLAQVCDETGAFSHMAEKQGRSLHGDWFGRGFLQLTGEENYKNYRLTTADDIVSKPKLLTQSPHDILSALWYYIDHLPCKENADNDDFNMVCARINGGFIGYESRLKYFNSIVKTLKAQHLEKIEVDGEFLFENSSIFDNKFYSLAWGLWHDPDKHLSGITNKSKNEAIKGYGRAKELWGPDSQRVSMERKKIYGIHYDQLEQFINARLNALS
ncbi:hypothetical protein [Pseudescherichia vulneris]|uniref:hypothetical protein n=1 Tax=Pseudescherichia vulneris TaxID=566 RepID=UPI0028A88D9A|nr:hypothetical protein [Pseudescherichia vulneris]